MPPKCGAVLDATEIRDCPRCHRNVGLSYATELWDCGTLQKCGTVPYAIDILRHDRKCGNFLCHRNMGLSYAKEMWECPTPKKCGTVVRYDRKCVSVLCHLNVGPLRQRNVQPSKAAEMWDCPMSPKLGTVCPTPLKRGSDWFVKE